MRRFLGLASCSLALATLTSSLAAPVASASNNGFAVTPLSVDVNIDPGTSKTQTITVLNTMSSKSTFTVSKEDYSGSVTDPASAPVLLGGEVDSPMSGYDWLSTGTSSFSLSPGDSKAFTVTMTAPSGASGGHYAALVISSSAVKISDEVSAKSEVAVLFLMNAGNAPPPELVIEDVTTTNPGETVIDYINEGVKAATPEATITYVDPITGEVVEISTGSECTTALPGAAGQCVVSTKDVGDSLLKAGEVVLANDGRKTKSALPTEWSGSWSSGLLPLVGMGLFGIYFFRLRRRRSNDDDGEDGDLAASF